VVSEQLKQRGFRCFAIHGDKSQNAREFVLRSFKQGRVKILIATDVASRGIGKQISLFLGGLVMLHG